VTEREQVKLMLCNRSYRLNP